MRCNIAREPLTRRFRPVGILRGQNENRKLMKRAVLIIGCERIYALNKEFASRRAVVIEQANEC